MLFIIRALIQCLVICPLLQELLLSFDYKTNTFLLPKLETKSQAINRSKNLKLLRECGVLKKVGKDVVIINPNFIIPPRKYRDSIYKHWQKVENEQDDPNSSHQDAPSV